MQGIAQGFTDQGSITPDNLIAGEFPRICRVVTITGGALVPKGSVLGRIDSSGNYKLSGAGESDGSQIPDAILLHEADATTGDIKAHAYFTGEFNSHVLNLGAGHTLETITQSFRGRSIFIRSNQQ